MKILEIIAAIFAISLLIIYVLINIFVLFYIKDRK